MVDRRAFLVGAGAASLALVAGVPPAAAAPDFDPADVFAELHAAGLQVSWYRPIGQGAAEPYYFISPRRGGFSQAHLDVMAKWADALATCPTRAARMEAFLAEFERSESTPG